MYRIIDLYKDRPVNTTLLPTRTGFDFWDDLYTNNEATYDREFARRYKSFRYDDFLDAETKAEARSNLKLDIYSILTVNQKKYAELYRVFLVEDEDDPITYNYDMVETTGAMHSEDSFGQRTFTKGSQSNTIGQQENTYGQQTFTKGSQDMTYGATSFTEGQQQDTIGQRSDTIGGVTNSHNVAPFNATTVIPESSDVRTDQSNTTGAQSNTKGSRTDSTTQHVDTEGQRIDTTSQHIDTTGSRSDTEGQRIDTEGSFKNEHDSDAWTLTRKGNIGVQTAGDILRIHSEFWKSYKFMEMIFNDICAQLLMIGD